MWQDDPEKFEIRNSKSEMEGGVCRRRNTGCVLRGTEEVGRRRELLP